MEMRLHVPNWLERVGLLYKLEVSKKIKKSRKLKRNN
jgi:hypothetical protein